MEKIYVALKHLTFPAGLIRAMVEQSVCKNYKIEIDDNKPLRNDELASHIEHDFAQSALSAFAICFRPFFICSILAFLVGIVPTISLLYFQIFSFPTIAVQIIALWLAVSLATNCFPLVEDAMNMWEKLYKQKSNILLKIVCFPGAVICYIGAYLEKYNVSIIMMFGIMIAIFMY
ncbi:MAG: hypothetical protein R3Y27_08675 [Clostridia bacterium]